MYANKTGTLRSTHDGFELFMQSWLPEEKTGRVLVIQHGLGEHSGRYENILLALQGSGTAVYALDARGHGRTGGKRGHVGQFQMYVDDLADLIASARQETGFRNVILLGHSLGGVIALQYALQGTNQENLNGLAVSSPGLIPVMDLAKHIKKTVGTVLAAISPATTVDANLDLKYLSHDEDVIAAYKADPLVHGKISFQMGANLFKLDRTIFSKAGQLAIPVYIFHGMEDGIVSVEGSRKLFEQLKTASKTLKLYDGLYHETMNEKSPHKEQVLGDLVNWIKSLS